MTILKDKTITASAYFTGSSGANAFKYDTVSGNILDKVKISRVYFDGEREEMISEEFYLIANANHKTFLIHPKHIESIL